VSGFSRDWLALREPHDAAARPAELFASLPAAPPERREIVDLGAGTGANLRYLAPLLGGAQRWLLVDDDAVLDAAFDVTSEWAVAHGLHAELHDAELRVRGAAGLDCLVRRARVDLARDLASLDVPRGALVTSSALLDLVSAEWLNALAARCAAASSPVLFALNYDGRTTCTPAEPEDAEVLELVNRHQRTDKSFGPALGPTAAASAEAAFARHGYRLTVRPSDWRIPAAAAAMQRALVDGWLGAALELAPERHAALTDWRRRRRAHIDGGRSSIVVGHVDLLGVPR
jgi:hypothetical protein